MLTCFIALRTEEWTAPSEFMIMNSFRPEKYNDVNVNDSVVSCMRRRNITGKCFKKRSCILTKF